MISDKVFDAVLDCILHSEADTREKIAQKILKILNAKNPKFAYSINRNPLLLLLNILPKRLQLWIIRRILK